MKSIGIFILCLMVVPLSAQNPFADGIHELKTVDYKQGSNKYAMFGFRLIMNESCSSTYCYTEVITNSVKITTFLTTTSWNWKSISSLEQDTVNHILRLNAKENMTCTDKDLDSQETASCQMNDMVNIYFKTNVVLKAAIDWALQKVKECGGKAWLVN